MLSFLCSANCVFASDSLHYIQKSHQLGLADDPFWKELLHFHHGRSRILDQDFFLSKKGNIDAKAELDATIEAYFTNEHSIKREWGDQNIVCIFPARYMWLNEKLELPGFNNDSQVCPGLAGWARLDQVEDISLIYVSGYLGNPASSFGHVMLSMKQKNSEGILGLFDTTITYGAAVPANENMLFYILNGLFGGYSASFSDRYFYTHDQVYTNREFRDMWDYTLNLSERDKKMLIYHAAELLTKRHKYYFFSANCAQGMAILIDIFVKEDVYHFEYPIYVPEELFHRLQYIDQQRREKSEPALIKSVKYVPSARRYLFYETKELNAKERKVYKEITKNHEGNIASAIEVLETESRIHVLNALLAYQYYQLMQSDEGEADPKLKIFKDKILLERLGLPAKKADSIIIPEVASPREVSPPSTFNISYVSEPGNDPFTLLGATVFRKESVGLNALELNELVGLSLNIGIPFSSDKVFIDNFEFIRIRDFRTFYLPEAKENPLSWRFRAGIDRVETKNDISYDYVIDGGYGLVGKIKDLGIIFGFVNASMHSLDQQYRVGPSIGSILGNKKIKLELDFGLEYGLEKFAYTENYQSKLQYQINKSHALQFTYEKANRERFALNYIFYW